MKKYFVDTNIILRFLLHDNPAQYKEAEKAFAKAKTGEIELVICQAIIFEVAYVLGDYYKIKKEEVANMLGKIMGIPYLIIEDRDEFLSAIPLYNQHTRVSLIDCFLAAKAQAAGAQVLSFDKSFKKQVPV